MAANANAMDEIKKAVAAPMKSKKALAAPPPPASAYQGGSEVHPGLRPTPVAHGGMSYAEAVGAQGQQSVAHYVTALSFNRKINPTCFFLQFAW